MRSSRLRRVAQAILAVSICGSAQALAGAHYRVVEVFVVGIAASGVLALVGGSLVHIPAPAWVFAGLGSYCLLQSAPLPIGLVERLSPHAADRWARALQPLGEAVRTASLSVDPGATSLEAAKWMSYAVAFSIAAAFGRRRGAAPVITLVCLSALAVAVVSLAHAAVGATSVFGIYEAKYAKAGWRIGPILNSNTLAGYCLLGTACAMGLFASGGTTRRKAAYGAAIVILTTVVAVSGSRGGFAALLLTGAAFALVYGRGASGRVVSKFPITAWAALGLGLAAAVSFALMLVPDAWEQLSQRNTEKLRVWMWSLPMLKDFLAFGVGRGAFETAFAAYKPGGDDLVYTHPENIVIQWISELGLPVAAGGFALFIWLLRPSQFGTRRHVGALGALVGVAGLLLQNLVDLGLELLAPMLALTVVLGACFGQNVHRRGFEFAWMRWGGAVIVTLSLSSSALALSRGNAVSLERLALHSRLQQIDPKNPSAVRDAKDELRASMLRHPAEPYFPRLGGMLALRSGENPYPWLARALDLSPTSSRTHWVLANALRQQGAISQAMLEARLTAEYDPAIAPTVGATVARWSEQADDILRAAPPGPAGGVLLYYATTTSKAAANPTFKATLLREAVRHDGSVAVIRIALAETLLAVLHIPNLDKEACLALEQEILAQASSLDQLRPDTADSSEIRAHLFTLLKRPAEAERAVGTRCPALDDREQIRCWSALLAVAPRDPDHREMLDRVSHRLVKAACLEGGGCATALVEAGDAMAQIGDRLGALDYFQRAAGKEPSVGTFLRVADTEAALGRKPLAERALTFAEERAAPNSPELQAIEARRRALRADALTP